jgi:surfeit locus 1 family protein
MEDAGPGSLAKYARTETVTVRGRISLPHVPRIFGVPDPTLAPGQDRLDTWNAVNLDRIQAQLPYAALPVYIQAEPDSIDLPIANPELPDITEGSHLGYAAQWFTFAGLLAIGYPFFVRKQINAARGRPAGKP